MLKSELVSDRDAKSKPLLESLCPVGEPMSVEWKGTKYPTIFRGAKGPIYVLSNSSSGSGKAKYEIATPGYILVDIPVVGGKQVLSISTPRSLSGSFRKALSTVSSRLPSGCIPSLCYRCWTIR